MKNLLERIRQYWTKIKKLNSDDQALSKNQNQCRFPGCADFGTLIYICRYGRPCFCDYHSRENSPWTKSHLEKCEWRGKTTMRTKTLPI